MARGKGAGLALLAGILAAGEARPETDPVSGAPAPQTVAAADGRAASGRGAFFAGIVGGNVEAADSRASGTYQCYLCTPVTDEARVRFSGGGAVGLRAGMWGTTGRVNPGIAVEAGGVHIAGDHVTLHYQGFGVAGLLRLPLLRNAQQPGGRLIPYAGLQLFRLQGGSVEVSLPALPRPLSGTPSGLAHGALLGLALPVGHLEVAAEVRKVNLQVRMDAIASDEAEFRLDSTQTLLAISYCF